MKCVSGPLAGFGGGEGDKEVGVLGKEGKLKGREWRGQRRKGREGGERRGREGKGRGEREGEGPDQVMREIDAPGHSNTAERESEYLSDLVTFLYMRIRPSEKFVTVAENNRFARACEYAVLG